ncbi:alpha/beta fold hydrolase, partial [Homoserinimonas sp. OAct 916]
ASFVPLAPHLSALQLVAIDLPGHGHSAHLPAGASYTTAAAICHVLDVADALGWDRFSLLGHSMGAGIASLTASVSDRVDRLVAIEALGGLRGPEEETAHRLREHVNATRA